MQKIIRQVRVCLSSNTDQVHKYVDPSLESIITECRVSNCPTGKYVKFYT